MTQADKLSSRVRPRRAELERVFWDKRKLPDGTLYTQDLPKSAPNRWNVAGYPALPRT
jgi:hypothetical protein